MIIYSWMIQNRDGFVVAHKTSSTVGAISQAVHVAISAIGTFFVVSVKTLPKFASYSETKNEYKYLFETNFLKTLKQKQKYEIHRIHQKSSAAHQSRWYAERLSGRSG
ncbi:MAG: hypothetical protein KA239_00850 [Bacteroidia bacterium]|nr:hypothetical protein [Bacteroidia bacterium]MBP6720838.1 hypothetical protein [Bacteroidia bacterium]